MTWAFACAGISQGAQRILDDRGEACHQRTKRTPEAGDPREPPVTVADVGQPRA
ncbi:MAG: hypothetical protein ACREP0_12400 [Rhodanobacteraceae bacterium]